VHEAFLRLVGDSDPGWESRPHFFGAAAQAMRQVLLEQARRKGARKPVPAGPMLQRRDDRRRVLFPWRAGTTHGTFTPPPQLPDTRHLSLPEV
jgi:hypothetical protein